ncbi:MAG: hypothetical protein GX555_15965 [Actinomycetales bacterium]|nr:hypothetical protein [Actinomycetales bacterium]
MPWSPPGDVEASNPVLDPFRERAGVLNGEGAEDGAYVLLDTETHWSRTGGHWWWSRWSSPREVVHARLRRGDGQIDDWIVSGEDLDAQVASWRDGLFRHDGATYRVEWQDDEESERVRAEVFGLD